MLNDQELQSLRNLGNEAEAAADEINRLRARVLELEAAHEDASGAVLQERERCAKLAEGEKFKDGSKDARRGPRGVGTWHESSPMGYAMRELAREIRGA